MALTEFRPEYGGTRCIPGSHLWEDALKAPKKSASWEHGVYAELAYPPGQHEELVVQPTLAPGSAFAFLGTTVHGAGTNSSANVYRRALVIQYCVGWVRPSHSNHLLYPPEVAKTLPESVQKLLGYHSKPNTAVSSSKAWILSSYFEGKTVIPTLVGRLFRYRGNIDGATK